jgi:hypothetical protein
MGVHKTGYRSGISKGDFGKQGKLKEEAIMENEDEIELSDATKSFLDTYFGNQEASEDDVNNAFEGLDEVSQQEVLEIVGELETMEAEGGEQLVQQMEPSVKVQDLVTHAINQAPLDFQKTFGDLMDTKLGDAVAERKFEVAQNLFNEPVEPQADDAVEPQVDDVVEPQVDSVEPPVEEEEELDEGKYGSEGSKQMASLMNMVFSGKPKPAPKPEGEKKKSVWSKLNPLVDAKGPWKPNRGAL